MHRQADEFLCSELVYSITLPNVAKTVTARSIVSRPFDNVPSIKEVGEGDLGEV